MTFNTRSESALPVSLFPDSRGSRRSQRRVNTARWEASECSERCTVSRCRRVDGSNTDGFFCFSSSKKLRQSSSVASRSSSESGSETTGAFLDAAGLVCNSSTHQDADFKSDCVVGIDSNLSSIARRFSGTCGSVVDEEDDRTGLNRGTLLTVDRFPSGNKSRTQRLLGRTIERRCRRSTTSKQIDPVIRHPVHERGPPVPPAFSHRAQKEGTSGARR